MQGKTTLFKRILHQSGYVFDQKPARIWFLYNCHQPLYDEMAHEATNQGIEFKMDKAYDMTEEDVKGMASPNGQTLICVDDNTISVTKSMNMAHLFTVARHFNCSMVLFLHTVFGGNEAYRIISQNTAYYFLMSSPRMRGQVATLGGQMGMRKELVHAYDNKVQAAFSYLLVDLNVKTANRDRIRDNVLENKHYF